MYTEIELDKPRRLRFDLTAIRDLENAMGGKPLGGILSDLASMGLNALCLSLLYGLKHEDPTLNLKLVTKILSDYLTGGGTLDVVYGKVKDALDGSGLFRTKDEAPVTEGNARAVSS